MNKFTFFLLIIFSANIFADDSFDCYSTSTDLNGSANWAATSIDLFAKKRYDQAVNAVDACFDIFSVDAVVMQKNFNAKNTKLPPSGRVSASAKKKIHDNWAVNDVSVALWAKARSLEKMGEIELAKNAYSQCIFLSHGRAWDPNGWFWAPSSDCIKRGRKLIK